MSGSLPSDEVGKSYSGMFGEREGYGRGDYDGGGYDRGDDGGDRGDE